MSAAERASEASRAEQAQRVSGASERANGQASGPVLSSRFLFVPDHSAVATVVKHHSPRSLGQRSKWPEVKVARHLFNRRQWVRVRANPRGFFLARLKSHHGRKSSDHERRDILKKQNETKIQFKDRERTENHE